MMGNIQYLVFTYLVGLIEAPFLTATIQVMNAFLAFVATPLKVALVLYVALTGILIIRGDISEAGTTIIGRVLKMALVVWVLTGSGVYQQYIYDFFFVTLPSSLSQALSSSSAPAVVNSSSFDQVWIKAWRGGLEVWRALGWQDVPEKLLVLLFWIAAIISTVFCFAIWLVSRIILALYIAIGPVLVGLALFPATRSIFERWIGAMISCVILQITTIVLLSITLTVEQRVVGEIVTIGSTDPMAMIQVMIGGVILFVLTGFVAFFLPSIASTLSGGLSFHTGAIGRAIQNFIGSTGTKQRDNNGNLQRVGRSGAVGLTHYGAVSAGKGAMAVGRAAYRRIRPPTGGSLSRSETEP